MEQTQMADIVSVTDLNAYCWDEKVGGATRKYSFECWKMVNNAYHFGIDKNSVIT